MEKKILNKEIKMYTELETNDKGEIKELKKYL
jgi:hypothetical protein